jgi:hypothetical protein
MKANLPSLFCLLCLFLGQGLVTRLTRAAAPADGINIQKDANGPATSQIEIENWVKPKSGWLYVLDPKPDGVPGGRVWLVDPETGKVMGSIRTGNNPDFALSPDGSRLYVASITQGDSSELAVIDTAQGAVIHSGTVEYREVADVLPAFSTMAVSGDGLALRMMIDLPESVNPESFLLATFDTQSGEFVPGSVRLYNCGPARFISHSTAGEFVVFCPRTNRIRLIRVDATSYEQQNSDIVLPWERRIGTAEVIESPGGQAIAIIRGDGAVVQMNIATREFLETAAQPVLPNRIPPAAWPISPDGSRVYLGYNSDYDRAYDNRFYLEYGRAPNLRPKDAMASEFRVFDTHTWRKIGTIKTKVPFWSGVIGDNGKMLYAMAPEKHSILVIDTAGMRQIRTLKVGGTPALALTAP